MKISNAKEYSSNFVFVESQTASETETKPNVFLMWRITINFLYYFGITPFKCEFCSKNGEWYLKTSWFHKVRSLLQAWMPFFMNEMNFALREIREHFAIQWPNAKAYLNIFYKLVIKSNYFFVFATLFCRKKSLTSMLNHILTTCVALERYSGKLGRNFGRYIAYFLVVVLILTRIGMNIMWITNEVTPNYKASENISEKYYKVFVSGFRNRFHMNVSATYTYTSLDYFIGIYEIWLMNISRVMWVSFDTIISGVIPLTFTITMNKFEEVLQKFSSEGDIPALTICRLFDNLKNMSKHINSNWGIVCLIWAFYYATRNAIDLMVWSLTKDAVGVVESLPSVVSVFLLLYLSGDVYCKITTFKDWLTDEMNWDRFKSDTEKNHLQRIVAQLDGCCVGIGKTGLYRLTYGFAAEMFVLSITLFVINFDS